MQKNGVGSKVSWLVGFKSLPRKIKLYLFMTLTAFQCTIFVALQSPMMLNFSSIPPDIFGVILVLALIVDGFYSGYAIYTMPKKYSGMDFGLLIGTLFTSTVFTFNQVTIVKLVGEVFFLAFIVVGCSVTFLKQIAEKKTSPKQGSLF